MWVAKPPSPVGDGSGGVAAIGPWGLATLVALRRGTANATQPEPGEKHGGVQGKGFPRLLMPWCHHGTANQETLTRSGRPIQVLNKIYDTVTS